jgi:hypothetical protein
MFIKIKNIYLAVILLISGSLFSQNSDYSKIASKIQSEFPEINLTNKILIISVWSSSDVSSRDMNKEFLRTYKMYQYARLSGGLKGVVFISISSDTDKLNYEIALKKDLGDYPYSICDLKALETTSILSYINIDNSLKNLVFNSNGELITKDISTDNIFITFNKLTTR